MRVEKGKPFRILSFDISASPGVAVLEVKNRKPSLIYVDHVVTDSTATDSQRYEYVRSLATKAVYEHRPIDVIVREKFIRGGSKRSTQLVFGAWSAIDMALGAFGYAVDDKDEIVASSVKKLIGGKGGASKEEVAEGVIKRLGEGVRAQLYTERGRLLDDRADAVAIGLAYLIREGLIDKEVG